MQTLTQLPATLQQAQAAQPQPRPALKLDPPTYNGCGDFRERPRKLELIYAAKQLNDQEKLTWTLALLQDGASRVATHANAANYTALMDALARRYTNGNDAYHYRAALADSRQTGDIDAYVDRFLELQSRVTNLPDEEARFTQVRGPKPEVQVHMLGPLSVPCREEVLQRLV